MAVVETVDSTTGPGGEPRLCWACSDLLSGLDDRPPADRSDRWIPDILFNPNV